MKLQANEQVNKIGKYLYKHIDGAYKISFSVNTCDVYMFMYYQAEGMDMNEMRFDLSITTYQNKIRVNILEITDMERCIGQDIYRPEELENLELARNKIYNNVVKHISKTYSEYEFVF